MNFQTGGGAKSALALNWIDLERFWQCKSLNWHLCESKKVCKYGATMHIEGSRSLWRKNYPSGGVRSSNWLSSQLENLTSLDLSGNAHLKTFLLWTPSFTSYSVFRKFKRADQFTALLEAGRRECRHRFETCVKDWLWLFFPAEMFTLEIWWPHFFDYV